MQTQLIIIGASGFGAEAAWVLSRMANAPRLIGFCDDDPAKASGEFCSVPLLGSMRFFETRPFYFCAIGDNNARQKAAARADALGWTPFSIMDPTAVVAPDATLGRGIFLGVNTVVSCGAKIGDHVIANHNSVIGHNASVGSFAHLCPGVKISGFCNIGERAFLGTNATVIPRCNVGACGSVGAGATVLRSLPDNARLVPMPGRVLFE